MCFVFLLVVGCCLFLILLFWDGVLDVSGFVRGLLSFVLGSVWPLPVCWLSSVIHLVSEIVLPWCALPVDISWSNGLLLALSCWLVCFGGFSDCSVLVFPAPVVVLSCLVPSVE